MLNFYAKTSKTCLKLAISNNIHLLWAVIQNEITANYYLLEGVFICNWISLTSLNCNMADRARCYVRTLVAVEYDLKITNKCDLIPQQPNMLSTDWMSLLRWIRFLLVGGKLHYICFLFKITFPSNQACIIALLQFKLIELQDYKLIPL